MILDEQLEDLIEIGHMARMLKMNAEAETIFRTLMLAYPERAFPHTGLAFLYLEQERFARACSEFSAALDIVDDPNIRAWYATALHCLKQYQAVVTQLLIVRNAEQGDASQYTAARGMAERMLRLDELRKFVHKG